MVMTNMQRIGDIGESSAVNEASVSQAFPPRLRGHHRRDGNILRDRGMDVRSKAVFARNNREVVHMDS